MNNAKQADYARRDAILQCLSDEEAASVSTSETAARLANGDEYVDLEHISDGVQRATDAPIVMGRVLPRKAVCETTWLMILRQVPARKVTTRVPPGLMA